jgi:hypothetical protein
MNDRILVLLPSPPLHLVVRIPMQLFGLLLSFSTLFFGVDIFTLRCCQMPVRSCFSFVTSLRHISDCYSEELIKTLDKFITIGYFNRRNFTDDASSVVS